MRKQTAPRTREHGQASSPEQRGLIAQGRGTAARSAREEYALDDRSHRTIPAFTGEGPCARISGVHENMPGPSSTSNGLLGG